MNWNEPDETPAVTDTISNYHAGSWLQQWQLFGHYDSGSHCAGYFIEFEHEQRHIQRQYKFGVQFQFEQLERSHKLEQFEFFEHELGIEFCFQQR